MIEAIVRRRAVILLAVFCTILFGGATYAALPRESSPDVEIPVIVVSTPYVGVSPADIERLVTIPMENELASIKGLKTMRSTSSEGVSIVRLEFESDVEMEDALQRVRDKVDLARVDLPDDVEDTDVREISISDFPIMIVTIGGPAEEETLKQIGERLEEEVERIPGVLTADLTGGRTREIRVELDPVRMAHYGIGFGDVRAAIRDENLNMPGGDVVAGDATFLLRVPGEFTDPSEIEGVAIKRIGDRPVFVRDVGRVVDGFARRESYARMNGDVAVSLAITKRAGANVLDIADAIRAACASAQTSWPEGVSYRILSDESKMVRDMVGELENGILSSLVLVLTVLLFFMGVRNAAFVALAIPLSMLLSFLFIGIFGMTLNMVVLFSLIMAMGMLVDNAIVVVENIYRHLEEGEDRVTAAIVGTREVAGAVAASTATTVAAFLPLLFWSGMLGSFMGFMPKTIVTVLVSSLAVAIFVLPVATSTLMKTARRRTDQVRESRVMSGYRRVLGWSIDHRYLSALFGFLCLVGTFAVYGRFNHGTEFFPETDPNRATILVRAPDGTDVEATDAIIRRVEALVSEQENVDVFVAETGVAGASNPMAASETAPNWGRINIDFLPDPNTAEPGEKARVEPTPVTIERLRAAIADISGAEISIEKERMGPQLGAQLQVEVVAEDVHEAGAVAARIRRGIEAIDGTVNVTDDYRSGRPEMRLRIDRGAAKRVGVSTATIADTVRTAVAGTEVSSFRDGEDEYDIVVQLAPEFRDDLQSVLGLHLPGSDPTSPDTFPVPLSAVASYELGGGSGSIKRDEQELVVTISGDVAEGYNIDEVRAEVMGYVDGVELPPGVRVRPGGASEEEAAEAAFLGKAFLVAVFLIAFVLVWQFNRFDLPFIILASVVLSLIGVLWGLLLTGHPFSIMMTGLGVISLAGIVVNNAIVLLDYVEQLRSEEVPVREALIRAGVTRFRPVILTAITTVLGLVPMALGVSFDFFEGRWILGSVTSTWWGPMAVAICFGLVVATVLTLVMVPTMYGIFEDLRAWWERTMARLRPPEPVVHPPSAPPPMPPELPEEDDDARRGRASEAAE